jgi:uncharacterized protein (UPF0210 family)
MNLRTLAMFLPGPPSPEQISFAGRFLTSAVAHFEKRGIEVQTRRVSFAHPFLPSHDIKLSSDALRFFRSLDHACETNQIDFCSLGAVREPHDIRTIAKVIVGTARLYAFADVLPVNGEVDPMRIHAAADAVVYVGRESISGLGNFRFSTGFSIKPGCPFFPASYHDGSDPYFTLGTQNSDLLVEAFRGAKSLAEAEQNLQVQLLAALLPVEVAAQEISESTTIAFRGTDTSVVPILDERYSYGTAFEHLGIQIGEAGTLAVCALVTRAIRTLPLSAVGFRGIMLPALEDFGLAKAISAGSLDIHKLLAYSSVCGVGLDTIPLPGSVTSNEIVMVMNDVAALSRALSKPLMARLLPIPNGNCGDLTTLESPYLCNTRILPT